MVWRLASHTHSPASALTGASAGIIAVAWRRSATELGRSYTLALASADGGKRPVPQPRMSGGMMATSATAGLIDRDRKSTRLNSSHANISYAVFCLKKKNTRQ